MQTALRKMGNSTGMILPRALLVEMGVGIGTAIDLKVEDGKLVGSPVRRLREGWEADAARIGGEPFTEEERDWAAFGNEADDDLRW
jgi:antitoxin MazE